MIMSYRFDVSMKEYPIALSYFKKTLKLFEKSVSPKHSLLSVGNCNAAKTLVDLNRYEEATEHPSI